MTFVVWALALGPMLPMLVFIMEGLAGIRPGSAAPSLTRAVPPFAVLIPAHDEARGIAAVLARMKAQLRACDRVLVVADNCSDATARIARGAGVEVVERNDADRIGKAHALAFGRRILWRNPPEIVLVVDADCDPADGALQTLAASAARHRAAVQGRYLLSPPDDASPLVRISSFAFLVKNLIRQRGLQRLCGVALLQGSGMAFPWRIFSVAPLDRSSLVEDLKLGLDLAILGRNVRFDETAHFRSAASSLNATRSQRTRWEHGAIGTAIRYVPRLLLEGALHRPALLLLAADMTVPPLALLVTAAGAVTIALLLAGGGLALTALLAVEILFAGVVAAIWLAEGRTMMPSATLLRLPRYLLWKLPVYGRVITRPQRDWVRTSRLP